MHDMMMMMHGDDGGDDDGDNDDGLFALCGGAAGDGEGAGTKSKTSMRPQRVPLDPCDHPFETAQWCSPWGLWLRSVIEEIVHELRSNLCMCVRNTAYIQGSCILRISMNEFGKK
jgi:hypothetical protein